MIRTKTVLALVGVVALIAAIVIQAQTPDPNALVKKADRLFEQKNYKEAAASYRSLLDSAPKHEKWVHAAKRVVTCNLRLRLFDDGLKAAEHFIKLSKATPHEARAERFTGNLYMLVPHWGTRAGGEFHRAQWKQGIRVRSYRYDKSRSVAHLERARELYAKYEKDAEALGVLPEAERKNWPNERIECIFDLANCCARFGIYENQWTFWYSFWGERDEFIARTAGEEDFDEYHSDWQLRRKRPIGLRVGPDGKPIFPTAPKAYSKELGDDQKILYLLKEARELDRTENRKYAALGFYRQAMLARSRFGMDRLNNYAGIYYWGGSYPLREELKDYNPWEMKDNEAIVLVGGKIRKVELPSQWDVLGLLRIVVGDHKKSGIPDQAQYAVALYHQSRQQYRTALTQYTNLKEYFAGSKWIQHANTQIQRIKEPQVRMSQAGVQLPKVPAAQQVSYRNTSKIWFVARRVDHEGFIKEVRNQKIDKRRGLRGLWGLSNWHAYFTNFQRPYRNREWLYQLAGKKLGKEVARWADDVKDDGSHRYAHTTLQTPLKEPGAYLVYAYLKEPPADDAKKSGADALLLGKSRAIIVLTDLAFVEKKVKQGNLYFVTDAATGAPIVEANVSILHVWSVYNRARRRSDWFKKIYNLTTDKDGMAVLDRPVQRRGNLHVLVKAGKDRLAWSRMSYWSRYSPSRMRQGLFAYCITDRPVYRPGQTVRYKVWLRLMDNGQLRNQPSRSVTITVYDRRGDKVQDVTKRTDEYGGVEGDLALGDEARLGVYRIQIRADGRRGVRYAGGQNFRVEEYKKPEFEVAVEPGKTHTKLGDKVTALVKATYYFGGPVTDATVSYKVFREEYTHGYYFPGPWDWLYGLGYGWTWYEHPWFEWWGQVRGCWIAPPWWGYSARNPVRELVTQGQGPIGKDGTIKVEIDTAPALRDHGDRDHRYVVQAEVRDSSRRVITGEGGIKVTRRAFYAFVQSDRGYYRPGEEMVIRVRCLTPENQPVKTEGMLTVSSVVFGGPENARIEEKELRSEKVATDERGMFEYRLRYEKSGQLKFKFEAPDKWKGVVAGYGLVWVCGRDFDGKLHRFNNLELITDKRTYKPGDTAHVMINTKHSNSYVLFSDDVDSNAMLSWKLLHLPNRSVVVDVPIKKTHRPNFFLEATTVADTRVHQQKRRICVPPEEGILNVSVKTDKAQYKPGEKATVFVTAHTLDGKPARTQVTLSAFDKSVLYIQPEYTPPIAKFFHGHLRTHYTQMTTNLLEQFSAWGYIYRPFQQIHPVPPEWSGLWGPTVGDWRDVGPGAINGFAAGGERTLARGRKGAAPAMAQAGEEKQSANKDMVADKAKAPGAPEEAGGGFAEAEVRQKFADTALWLATLTTDADGTAKADFEMPENLTTWKINSWAMTRLTKVGQADASAVTTKKLLVRLQAPRFFMEYDEVVISANVHNYLDKEKTARVSLDVPAKLLKMIGNAPAAVDVKVPAGDERRVDWRVKVLEEGRAKITVKALTDEESDAMAMEFPVLVHGMTKQIASTGSMRPEEKKKTITVELNVPEKRRPELTRLDVQFAPSLAGAMMDALPYCLDYPYYSNDSTMSRFLPAVLTLKTLGNMGVKLEDLKNIRGRLAEVRRMEKDRRMRVYADNPIFDTDELNKIIQKALARVKSTQNGDGGWGWWKGNDSSAYFTTYVLYALCTAQQCDVQVDENVIKRGMNYLKRREEGAMREKYWAPHTRHAYVAYVLSLKKVKASYKPAKGDLRSGDLIKRLHEGRDKLNLYGKALLAMAHANLGDMNSARLVLRNIMQYKQENKETQIVWFRTPSAGWWYWWNSDIETNAMILRAIVRIEPKSKVAPPLVKWLLNNRRNGYYWRSTRDTTMCVAAMSDFAVASGESAPDYTLTLDFDNGQVVKKVKINKDNFFTYDNRFVLDGMALSGGKHTLKITKDGPGALYFNTYLRYFTKELPIKAAGHELKLERTYFKLVQIPYEVEVEGAEGQKLKEKRLRYERVPVNDGDTVKSGEVVQVELRVKSDNDYTYLALEDMKPAGFEPTQVRSGGKSQEGFWSYMELRDEKAVFFVGLIARGEHLLRYRLRAEVPGVFHALPTVIYAMYVPELRANGDERIIKIVD